uniref:JmjC domain-containing protein n=1 Tax=Amorphochlora amoebiformis TaxID=1561963 RepID=A0A7S0D2Y5_9EUKA|mmetsp:Transcript_18159/g.28919  ORF Transcript_18159/g.28919 Transcript_18159/m.28919 type:complete len:351 (+) Transcript_18159:2-1054(+)
MGSSKGPSKGWGVPRGGGRWLKLEGEADHVEAIIGADLDEIANPPSGVYRYLYGPAEAFCHRLIEDIPGFEDLFIVEKRAGELNVNIKPTPTLWMSSANVTAQLHYDPSHNFHVLLHGSKQLTLYPPSMWRSMKLYPSVHPAHRQLQKGEAAPLKGGMTFTLEAGQVLYIPPYWFHLISAGTEGGVSMTVISPSYEEMLFSGYVLNHRFDLSPPFSEANTLQERLTCAFGLIALVLEKFLDNLYLRRNFVSFLKSHRHVPFSRHCREDIECYTNPEHVKKVMDDYRLQMVAGRVAAVFTDIRHKGGDRESSELLLSDYIEQVISWGLQGGQEVPCVIISCSHIFTHLQHP